MKAEEKLIIDFETTLEEANSLGMSLDLIKTILSTHLPEIRKEVLGDFKKWYNTHIAICPSIEIYGCDIGRFILSQQEKEQTHTPETEPEKL